MTSTETSLDCVIYRCGKQSEMYLYVRADIKPETLPAELLTRVGKLTSVMSLTLTPTRKLARVDVGKVIAKLAAQGYYLQMPPDGRIEAALYAGD